MQKEEPTFKTLRAAKTREIKYIFCDDPTLKEFYLGEGAFGAVFRGF